MALAANQKAILSYVVGKRTVANTEAIAFDLRARVVTRPQITSDGYAPPCCRFIGTVCQISCRFVRPVASKTVS